ncbi:HD-GYP domain-containing protein [Candidatus Latescibacterota bacterium]
MPADKQAIDVHTIIPDTLLTFEVFSNKNNKMEICCSSGQSIREQTIEEFKRDNITELYINPHDIKSYYLYLEEILDSIIYDHLIRTNMKAKTVYNVITNIADDLFLNPTQELVKRYKQTSFSLAEFILNDSNSLKSLINQTSFDFSVPNHSINVGIFSIGLARELLENISDQAFEEITAGFFLHDIGKTSISFDILNKKKQLSNADWELMKKHPEEGVRILEDFEESSDEIKTITIQHHERPNGGGYPKGLRRSGIHIYSKICSIADTFDALTSFRPYKKETSTFGALKIMKEEMFKDFDPEYFAKFVKLLS